MFKSFINQHQLSEYCLVVAKANVVSHVNSRLKQQKTEQGDALSSGMNAINTRNDCQVSRFTTFIHSHIHHHSALNVVLRSPFYFLAQICADLASVILPPSKSTWC